MSLRQVERLYKKMMSSGPDELSLDISVRAEIFQKIMDDLEGLIKKIERCTPGTDEYLDLDETIRKLLLKEIQVIIDDYTIAKQNDTLAQWNKMYGEIDLYIANFYRFRRDSGTDKDGQAGRYGFYDQNILS